LPVPADLAPGRYRLIAGMYDDATLERLSTDDGAGFVRLDHEILITE